MPDVQPSIRGLKNEFDRYDNERLRVAIENGSPSDVVIALRSSWIAKKARLKTDDGWKGWLPWTVWHATRAPRARDYHPLPEFVGIVTALLDAGLFSWDGLRAFPSLDWCDHPAFQAIETKAMQRLAKIPKTHKMLGVEPWFRSDYDQAYPESSTWSSLEWSWLTVAAKRGDWPAVERWTNVGGSVVDGHDRGRNAPLVVALKCALSEGISEDHCEAAWRCVHRLGEASVQEVDRGLKKAKSPASTSLWQDRWRDLVLLLIDQEVAHDAPQDGPHGGSNLTRFRESLNAWVQEHPIDVSVQRYDPDRSPKVQQRLAHLERYALLHDAAPAIDAPSRPRL